MPAENRLKILFIDHTAQLGGGEIALLGLIRCLDQDRFEPILLLFEDGPLTKRARATCNVRLLPMAASVTRASRGSLGWRSVLKLGQIGELVRFIFRLRSAIRDLDPAMVHTNSLKSDIVGGIAARLSGKKVIWHVRDCIDSDYLPARVAQVFRLLSRVIPTFVIAVSDAVLKTLEVPANHRPFAKVIYDGLDPVLLADSSEGRQLVGGQGSTKTPVIGLVGRIDRWKGQHIFIEAAAIVHSSFPSATFQIVGAPLFGEHAYLQELHNQVRSLGLETVMHFTGFVEDAPKAIRTLDIVVHASVKAEPFGLVIIEGMAQSKPIVATNGGGVPEIVIDGETGLLVPMGDARAMAAALVTLLSDEERAREMGRRGRARVQESFLMEQTAMTVQNLYIQLLREESGGRV